MGIARASDVLGAIIQPERNHDADGDTELLERDKTSPDVWGRKLTQVQRDNHGKHADGQSGNKAAYEHHRYIDGSGLDDGADEEDNVREEERPAAGEAVGDRTVGEGAEHGSEGQDRDHPALQVGVVDQVGKLFGLNNHVSRSTFEDQGKSVLTKLFMTMTPEMTP